MKKRAMVKKSVKKNSDVKLLELKRKALLKVPEEKLKYFSKLKGFDAILKYADVTPEGRLIVNNKDISKRALANGERVSYSVVTDVVNKLQYSGADILRVLPEEKAFVSLINPVEEKGKRFRKRDNKSLRAIENFAIKKGNKLIVDVRDVYNKAKVSGKSSMSYESIYDEAMHLKKLGYAVEISGYVSPSERVLETASGRGIKKKVVEFEMRAKPKSDGGLVKGFLLAGDSKVEILRRFPRNRWDYWETVIDKQKKKLEKEKL